jgi:HEAT repeat protein
MSARQITILLGMVTANILALSAMPQNAPLAPFPPPRSFAEGLRSHGITDLSEGSLIAELNNSSPEVRSLAAHKLAEDHANETAPAIESALAREKDLKTQVDLSTALWALHDEKGVVHLQSMCADPSSHIGFILEAVRALIRTQSPSGVCAETLLAAIGREKEPSDVAMAVSVFPAIFHDAPPDAAKRMVYLLQLLLLDKSQQTVVRVTSSKALAEIGAPGSADIIRKAMTFEEDPNVRQLIESNLKILGKTKN